MPPSNGEEQVERTLRPDDQLLSANSCRWLSSRTDSKGGVRKIWAIHVSISSAESISPASTFEIRFSPSY
jgi:hypothetical protein